MASSPSVASALLIVTLTLGAGAIVPAGHIALPTTGLRPLTWITLGASAGTHYASPFWGLNTGDDLTPKALTALGLFLNSTPFTVIRLGGGSDSYDPTTSVDYEAPSTGTHYVANSTQLTNFTWFKAWCYSRTPHCTWLTYLPGEENNTAAAVHVARWFHTVLHFVPTYWEFGNEPNAWTHFGKNRTSWTTLDNSTPTGMAYATMVGNYIGAVRAVYPADKFLGIQANCACNPPFISNTTQLNGPSLSGMAYHEYPWLNGSNTSLGPFYAALQSSRAIPNTTAHFRALMTAACAGCASMPLEIGEYQAGPVPNHSPLASTYAGAAFMAASAIQALESNVSTFMEFNIGWLYNTSNGAVAPEGVLYQTILSNMTMGTDAPVVFGGKATSDAYGVFITNGTQKALLIVNANTTHALGFALPTTLFGTSAVGSSWLWSPLLSSPSIHRSVALPTSVTIGSQAILLLTNY